MSSWKPYPKNKPDEPGRYPCLIIDEWWNRNIRVTFRNWDSDRGEWLNKDPRPVAFSDIEITELKDKFEVDK